jgi:ABC-type phosphate transport system substrate-binding protein
MNRRTFIIGIGIAALVRQLGGAPARADGDDVAVVVNKSNGVSAMNRSQLSALFKAKSTEFPGGTRATPVNLPPESPARQTFDYTVLGLRPDEVERFWVDSKIRSGVGSPRKVTGPAALVRVVSTDESAIGYVASSDVNDSVRVVARIRAGQVVAP